MELTRQDLTKRHACYSVHTWFNDKWLLIYIGVGTPGDATLTDLSKNILFRDNVTMDARLSITMVSSHDDRASAEQAANALIKAHRPHCNAGGSVTAPIGKRVRCITDDKIFDNPNQAANYYKISPSSLGKHLRGEKYANTVGGMLFERIPD